MDMYKGKLVVVLGLAKSGVAVAKLLHRFGAIVIVNDQKSQTLIFNAYSFFTH